MPAQSKKQQKFMGMVHAVQKGEISPPSRAVAEVAESIKPTSAEEFAKTKHKGLPEKADGKKKLRRKSAFLSGMAQSLADRGVDKDSILDIVSEMDASDEDEDEAGETVLESE